VGAYFSRYKWRMFRRRFIELGLFPVLDYGKYSRLENAGRTFRFTGEIESITDTRVLWVKGKNLTIPVPLENTECFLLPKGDIESGDENLPEKIKWDRASTLTEGVKVFIGGQVKESEGRLNFVSTKETPLIVVFYNCEDDEFSGALIRASRVRNDYLNALTPLSLFLGISSLVYTASTLIGRPLFRIAAVSATLAIFVPLFPVVPPGLLFTFIYRRLIWRSKRLRTYRDLAALALRHLQKGKESGILATGEKYGFIRIDSQQMEQWNVPSLLPPDGFGERKKREWRFFGVIGQEAGSAQEPSLKPSVDPFVSYGAIPAVIANHPRLYAIRIYALEAAAYVMLLLAIFVNYFFIMRILSMLEAY